MNPLKVKKSYQTNLSIEEISNIISNKLKEETWLLKNRKYYGKVEQNSFMINRFLTKIFQVKVCAELSKIEKGALLTVLYTPTPNLILVFLLCMMFFVFGINAKKFTLNGEEVSYFKQVLFSSSFIVIAMVFTTIATFGTLREVITNLESDLKLKAIGKI